MISTATISRRAAAPQDELFLRKLVVDTVARDLRVDLWPESVREHLLAIQYQSRLASLRQLFPNGEGQIVAVDGENCGWVWIADLPDQIRLAEILIEEQWRGRGVGTLVLKEVLGAARSAGKPVRLSVNPLNSGAIRLYQRLGFHRTGGDEMQQEMEWTS